MILKQATNQTKHNSSTFTIPNSKTIKQVIGEWIGLYIHV